MLHLLYTDLMPPERMNNPFCYEPHPLCLLAVEEVCAYLKGHTEWADELASGKMLGVLVCRTAEGQLGFLAAYSGQLGGSESWPWFVPAVFDYLHPDGYFKREEAAISAINRHIEEMERAAEYVELKDRLQQTKDQAAAAIDGYRQMMAEAKANRDALRLMTGNNDALIRESQYQKAELRRLKKVWKERLADAENHLRPFEDDISRLRQERHRRSDDLQRWLFDQFEMLNEKGERRTLTDIFAHTPQRVPPSGAGECCAPKLLQYAFLHHLRPLCMAEFWQGRSPQAEVRHHGQFYPACRGKCKPILEWMLGIDVSTMIPAYPTERPSWAAANSAYPTERPSWAAANSCVPIPADAPTRSLSVASEQSSSASPFTLHSSLLYEDSSVLVIDKPAGLLSVPGKTQEESVESLLRKHYGEVYMVHRLDQDTSGLMVVALTPQAYHNLQQQFLSRTIYKKYIALLDGEVHGSGTIRLPLRPDLLDRPRQVVDYEHGKKAVTDYEALNTEHGRTRIALIPHTGRTHQLRVHCAHADGLATPIVGDRLYGKPARRLCLHAAELAFRHPATAEQMHFSSLPGF